MVCIFGEAGLGVLVSTCWRYIALLGFEAPLLELGLMNNSKGWKLF